MSATHVLEASAGHTPAARRRAAAPPPRRPRYELFSGTLEELARRPAGPDSGRLIVTPNVDHLRLLSRSRALRRAYGAADVVLNDSRALDRAFIRGRAFVLTGADLAPEILARLEPGSKVFTIGCTEAIEAAMRAAYPGLELRFLNPSMGYIHKRGERRAVARAVIEADPACVFVCTGAPQSEVMAAQLKRAGCGADILCCGSGLLFLAGETPRAPRWMQMRGGEWLFRFLAEPRTRKRYVRDALFLLGSVRSLLDLRRSGSARFGGFTLACPGATGA